MWRRRDREQVAQKGVSSMWGSSPKRMHERRRDREQVAQKGVSSMWGSSPKRMHERRRVREQIAQKGVSSVWGSSPKRMHERKRDREYFSNSALVTPTKSSCESDIICSSYENNMKAALPKKRDDGKDYFSSKRKEKSKQGNLKKVNRKHKKKRDSRKHKRKHDSVELPSEDCKMQNKKTEVEEEIPIGPKLSAKEYGNSLLPGEGAAIVKYIESGRRIPRRGEVGISSEEIQAFEAVGYVMSGSRHHRMEAVRLRKEFQVENAYYRKTLYMFNKQERQKKEEKIMSEFKKLVNGA